MITPELLKQCTEVLEAIARDSLILSPLEKEDRIRLLVAAGQVTRPDKMEVRRRLKTMRRQRWEAKRAVDKKVRAGTAIRAARMDSFDVAPERQLGFDGGEGAAGAAGTAGEAAGVGDAQPELLQARACYICKEEFTRVHPFYDALCRACGGLNYEKRFQTADLTGRVAVITGARLKIGYQAALMMLRAGARVVVTTRFPQDAAVRYSREKDFAVWGARLEVYGLDLRHSPSVETFARYLDARLGRLDILINNAAQTVRRPPGFYAHLLAVEETPWAELPEGAREVLRGHEELKGSLRSGMLRGGVAPGAASGPGESLAAPEVLQEGTQWVVGYAQGVVPASVGAASVAPGIAAPGIAAPGIASSAQLSQIPYACDSDLPADPEIFPEGKLDADLQQVDLRRMNSWRMGLADVPTAELLEVQLVNSIAPFVLCAKLKPLMLRSGAAQVGVDSAKHVINVSAMEGKFSRHTKTDKHPHTNMAKAALNMMTLTSARDYAKQGIYMTAVDTGWVTDEDPAELSARKQVDHDFQPPLDIVDGAARVMDPVFAGLRTGQHAWGVFLKDYAPTEW